MKRDIRTMPEKATLEEAVKLMAASGDSGMPVVDDSGRLVGIVSEHDIIRKVVPSYEAASADTSSKIDLDYLLAMRVQQVRHKPVSSIMTRNVTAVSEEDPIFKVTSTMLMKKLKVLPVVRDDKVVGIISRMDVTQALLRSESTG